MVERPNFLFFIADGMQAQTISPESPCQTPNFDRLAARGIRFPRAYCSTPTCSPSRASLLTGLLPHNHGVLEVEHGRDPDQCELRRERPHFAQRLAENGYTNGWFGKWHVERTQRVEDFGWQVNGVKSADHVKDLGKGDTGGREVDPTLSGWLEGPVRGYNRVLHYGVTDVPPSQRFPQVTVDQAMGFLNQRNEVPGTPWCAAVSFSEPNEALVVSRETFERYDLAAIDLPENRDDDFAGKPNLYRRQKAIAEGLSDDHWRMARVCYYGRITEIDAQLGRLLDWLDESGQAENTIVVATADHGRYVGAHGFDAHNFGAFEEIYRIPLAMAGPGIAEGMASEALVQLGDLCPTVIELSGSRPIVPPLDFRSIVPVLGGERRADFRTAYGEYHGTRFPLAQRIWWEGDWKFVFNGFDFDELYDLANDPNEMVNLASLPAYRERVERMMAKIWQRASETGDRTLLESHYLSMRFAAVGPNAEAPSPDGDGGTFPVTGS